MKIFKRYILPALIWAAITGYVVCAAQLARTRQANSVVRSVEIEIADSTADRRLVTNRMVREWLLNGGVNTIGVPVREVDFTGIEKLITRNGFVDKAVAYAATDGAMYIKVSQRQPAVRFMTDGYDLYATHEGFVFGTPAASTVYVPVITGGYRPPFPPRYEGSARSHTDSLIYGSGGIAERIAEIDRQYAETEKQAARLKARYQSERRSKLRKRSFEKDESYKRRKADFDADKQVVLRRIDGERRETRAELQRMEVRRGELCAMIKKEEKKYEDFLKLLNFVEQIEDDDFWRSEIVQIIVDTTPGGALAVELVPRSGAFTIEFGEPDDVQGKLDKLMRFYRHGLQNIGWDRYSSINIACEGQVICRK